MSVVIDKIGKVLLNLILFYLILSGQGDVLSAKTAIVIILIVKVVLDVIAIFMKVRK